MTNINLPLYDGIRKMVRGMKEKGKDWDNIFKDYDNLESFGIFEAYGDDLDKDVWNEIVREQKVEYNSSQTIEKVKSDTTIVSKGEDSEVTVPTDHRTSWQLYRNKLIGNGWRKESVEKLEKTTLDILKKLNKDTTATGPVKGLVIGQVQSGKTASMAALMAMAADWGWNTFIVLSGMIENLRQQTQERLITDLNHVGNNAWISLPKLSRNIETGNRLQDMNLSDRSNQKYLNVCLKNKSRLENLISWFESDKNKLKQMKVLVIDDEADQASINTKKMDGQEEQERAKINELIIDLVEIGANSRYRPKSMNYISYTATPYANFLNESSADSLYPKDFIGVLNEPEEHFGPKQIFGLDRKEHTENPEIGGMDIIREVSEKDLSDVKELQEGGIVGMPVSLRESICWFFCATAALRYHGFRKPLSMLVHTSQLQLHHSEMAKTISAWIAKTDEGRFLDLCRVLYERESKRFGINEFRESNQDYPEPNSEIIDYPSFSEVKPLILELKNEITHIQMDEEGELTYHNGIHLCIDNCAQNGINDENMHIRLAYPSKEKLAELEKAPAFIIVGGGTLSRGLTIEGLVSTFFLRAATAGDSLMQMGRWFGFRRGYELFPRIWMTDDTREKFEFLAGLEEELKEELKEFSRDLRSPEEYGPRVRNTPSVSWLRVTASNKMQNAEQVDMDFTGCSIQTIHFENDESILRKNIETTENFLEQECGLPKKPQRKNAIFYKGVSFDKIRGYLSKMDFDDRSRVFNEIEVFCEWYEKAQEELNFSDWNVIVAGAGDVTESGAKGKWNIDNYSVGKVKRSAKSKNYSRDMANIGVLRGPGDVFADIEDEALRDEKELGVSNKDIKKMRERYSVEKTPQLIIYRIDKDSKGNGQNRSDLNFAEDIIGLYIHVPGDSANKPHAKGLRVKIEIENEE